MLHLTQPCHSREGGNPIPTSAMVDPRLRGDDKYDQPLRAFAPSRENLPSDGLARSREATKFVLTTGGEL